MLKSNCTSLLSKSKYVSRRSLFDEIRNRSIENSDLGKKLKQTTWQNYDMKKPRNYSPTYFKEVPSTKYEQVRYVNIHDTNKEPFHMPAAYNPILTDPKKDITSKETDEEFLPPINDESASREEEGEEFLPIDRYSVADYKVDASQNVEEEEFLPMNEQNLLDHSQSSNKVIKRKYIENDYYDGGNRINPENKNEEVVYIEEDDEENVVPARRYNIVDTNVNPVREDSDYTLYNESDTNEELDHTRRYNTPYVDSSEGNTSYAIEDEEEENVTPVTSYDDVITVYEDENGNTYIPKYVNEYDELDDETYLPERRYINLNKDDDGDNFISDRRCTNIVSTRYLEDSNQEATPEAYEEDESKRFIHLHPVIGSNN